MKTPTLEETTTALSDMFGTLVRHRPLLAPLQVREVLLLSAMPFALTEEQAAEFGTNWDGLRREVRRLWRNRWCQLTNDARLRRGVRGASIYARTPSGDALFAQHTFAQGTTPAHRSAVNDGNQNPEL